MTIGKAGRLRHRVAIERRSEGAYDALGHESPEWKQIDTVYAEVRDLSGRELERARQTVAEANVLVTIRHYYQLIETDRLRFRGRILNIGAITDPANNKEEMLLVCVEQKLPPKAT